MPDAFLISIASWKDLEFESWPSHLAHATFVSAIFPSVAADVDGPTLLHCITVPIIAFCPPRSATNHWVPHPREAWR